MTRKQPVDFMEGLRSLEAREGVRRYPHGATDASAEPAPVPNRPERLRAKEQPTATRRGKVAITQWVDPAVRKQLAHLAVDHEMSQSALVAEALNLLFEKYGKSPIAKP